MAELRRRDRVLFGVAALHAALFGAFVVGTAVDPLTVDGEPAWLKPAKFAGSIALVSATLGWVGPHLPVCERFRRRVSRVVGGGFVIEIALIGGQAARGVGSHFNRSSAPDAAVAAVMGVTIVVVTGAIAGLALRSWRGAFDVDPAFATGIRWGLALFVVGAFEGATMIAIGSNGVAPGGAVVPVLRWHLVGDFRLAHFVGLHALQALPLAGYLATTYGKRIGRRRRRRGVQLLAAAYALCLVVAFALAVVPALS